MEYHDSEKAKEVATRVEAFMDEEVLPREREALRTGDLISFDELAEYWEMAKERDLFAPQVPEEYGGQGLDFRDMLPSFEQVGRSLFGALAIRANAPDEGNMHTLEIGGSERIKEEYLRPLVQGEKWSAFSMTEPMGGGGSDPKMLRTTAEKDGDEWVINGHKWWSSQAKIADFLLVMARTDPDAHPYEGTSIILVPKDTDGVEIVRNYPVLGGHGVMETEFGHAEVAYDNVRVPVDNTIGEEGGGFRLAQLRLGGGRLTHCMRYCGMAERALDVAKAYMTEREAFGSTLADKQALRHRIADAETKLHVARTASRHAARELDNSDARIEVAMAKTFTANVTNEIIDLAVQCCGGNGIAKDLPLAHFYEEVRPFRIFDGADEVHRRTIARDAFEDVKTEEVEHVLRFGEPHR
ncbi:acyl-CoA dehydrogenase family protein [Halorientalis marina]|uniref:acyl-CoA dehydrogenase family protein n=1 Tax=Halorientalis marina TaxID=2931976 RepID=UPI001FF346FF|nr:acyl-CoA dehydrogenase family protein [Halorientalis marina]